jgi:hypothetical protein
MIKILYSQGCYGTYLTRCVYEYTSLNNNQYTSSMVFDSTGSSHIFRQNKSAKKLIWSGHPENRYINDGQLLLVLPHKDHYLDYWNNHFHKEKLQQIIEYTLTQFSIEEINNKLITSWGYDKAFDHNVPKWILREFFSMWMVDCFANRYSSKQYHNITNRLIIGAQDIILNLNNLLDSICLAFDLTKTVDDALINLNHKNFLSAQQYINSQLNCVNWVLDTIAEKQNSYRPKTIYDEAYIQYLFRKQGYEIKCAELNDFPQTTLEMKKLINANSHNHNPRRSKHQN